MSDQDEHPQSNETLITRQDFDTPFERELNDAYRFVLRTGRLRLLELEDTHFHFNSAVFLPDHGDAETIVDESDRNHVTGLRVLQACYLHQERMPSNVILIAGHTDRSGSDEYNFELSEDRANNLFHLLKGNRTEWVEISNRRNQVEDVQQILTWVHATRGWETDPGPINNHNNAATIAAVREFQKKYNEEFTPDPEIDVDGDPGEQTWGAFYDVYMAELKRLMNVDDDGLQAKRDSLKFLDDDRPTVGCGEKHPITQDVAENQRSQVDRRVHVLFFDPPHTPPLDCHPEGEACNPALCQIYGANRAFAFDPLPWDPVEVGRRFRIRLQLGDIDKVFEPIRANEATDTGVRQRLQAIGFLYEPLDRGAIGAIAGHAWNHFKAVEGVPDNADAVARLRERVRDTIVQGGTLPAPGDFNRIRIPGTYCVSDTDRDGGFFGNPSTAAGTAHFRVQEEEKVWNANARLGLIPIEAVLEERTGNDWGPARAGVRVHFQMIEPDAIPDGSAFKAPAARNAALASNGVSKGTPYAFNPTGHPDGYVTTQRTAQAPVADDPQVDNAHTDVGGKRGNDAVGASRDDNVLATGNRLTSFHDELSLQDAAASAHDDAVVVETNDAGRAVAMLMPSRMGGDRYKLRVFLDPVPEPGNDQASSGTEVWAVAAETGTLVVWRILRFSKYLQWNYPPGVPATEQNRCSGALNNLDFTGVIASEYSKAWCDVVVEPQARTAQVITQAQYQQAIRFARGRVAPATSGTWNLNVLLPDSTSTAGVNNPRAGFINILSAAAYDAAPKGPPPPGGWTAATGNPSFLADMGIVMHAVKNEMMEFFTRNALSGLTVIQVPVMTSLESTTNGNLPLGWWKRSGWGGIRRGCYLAFGSNTYSNVNFPYDHNRNTMHECGHTLYCPHQYTDPATVNQSAGDATHATWDEHDYKDLCVMGYMNRRPNGDFCGRCLLLFAGWDTHGIAPNSPGI